MPPRQPELAWVVLRAVGNGVGMKQMLKGLLVASLLWTVDDAPAAFAQDVYPSRPIRLIVSFAPGGGVDVVARLFADRMSPILGQPIIVENRGGASGLIAGRQVAQAQPDGYTILVATNSMIIGQITNPVQGLDIRHDLQPVASVAPQANIVLAAPDLNVRTLADVVALAKKGSLTYASPGSGSVPQLLFEHFFSTIAQAPMVHVPFAGAAPALTAIMSHQTDVGIVTLPPAVELVATGKIKGIAVTTPDRSAALPQIPTAMESGYPGISSTVWTALFVPAATPPAITARLGEAALRVAALPEIQARLRTLGYEATSTPGEQFQRTVATEYSMWADLLSKSSPQK